MDLTNKIRHIGDVCQFIAYNATENNILCSPSSSSHEIIQDNNIERCSYFNRSDIATNNIICPICVTDAKFHSGEPKIHSVERTNDTSSELLMTQINTNQKSFRLKKDDVYWERRKKNNISAKRSRENRKIKEKQIYNRMLFLEQENLKLNVEVDTLRLEVGKQRELLYNCGSKCNEYVR